ncbi:MFS transporter [Streptomyces olivoreticuli]
MREEATLQAGPAQVAARLDRLPITRRHRAGVVTVGLGLFFDMYEIFMSGVLGAVLADEFRLGRTATSTVLASAFIGMFLGVVVMGRLADRFGRRVCLLASIGIYATFSLVGAASVNAPMLIAARFLAGVGIGPELPLADAYLSDLLPARFRGRYTAWAYTVSFLGVPTVGLMAHWLVPVSPLGLAGWRWLFLIGAAGGFCVLLLRRHLIESPRWLASVGRTEEAERVLRDLEDGAGLPRSPALAVPHAPVTRHTPSARPSLTPAHRRRAAMMAVFHLLQGIGFYGFGTMAPLVLAAKGFSIVHSLLFSAVTFFGYPLGSLASIPLIERMERKYLIVGTALAMAGAGLAFGHAQDKVTIMVAGLCYTAVSNVFSNAYHVYQAEIFPTALRATAIGWTYSLSRVTSAVMPFAMVPFLNRFGSGTLFAVVAAAMTVIAVDIGVLGPTANGRSLEEVNEPAGAIRRSTPGHEHRTDGPRPRIRP